MYTTAKERSDEFKKELAELLNKWGAFMETDKVNKNPFSTDSDVIKVYIPSEHSADGKVIGECAVIDLGYSFDGDDA